MTSASLTGNGSACPASGALGAASVPGGARVLPDPPSRLSQLKSERAALRKQLERLQKARIELEGPSLELQSLAVEVEHFERETSAAIQDWISGGCNGHRPLPNAAAASPPSLSRRHEAATAAARANGVASGELDCQLAALRQRLATSRIRSPLRPSRHWVLPLRPSWPRSAQPLMS
jgi:hypothetical protein